MDEIHGDFPGQVHVLVVQGAVAPVQGPLGIAPAQLKKREREAAPGAEVGVVAVARVGALQRGPDQIRQRGELRL